MTYHQFRNSSQSLQDLKHLHKIKYAIKHRINFTNANICIGITNNFYDNTGKDSIAMCTFYFYFPRKRLMEPFFCENASSAGILIILTSAYTAI